jgi:hypothetical protein
MSIFIRHIYHFIAIRYIINLYIINGATMIVEITTIKNPLKEKEK